MPSRTKYEWKARKAEEADEAEESEDDEITKNFRKRRMHGRWRIGRGSRSCSEDAAGSSRWATMGAVLEISKLRPCVRTG